MLSVQQASGCLNKVSSGRAKGFPAPTHGPTHRIVVLFRSQNCPYVNSFSTRIVESVVFNVSPVISACHGSCLGFCLAIDFANVSEFLSNVDVRHVHFDRGGHTDHQSSLVTPCDFNCFQRLLGRDNVIVGGNLRCGKRCSWLGCGNRGADGRLVSSVSGSGGHGECCMSRCLTLADNIGVDIRVSCSTGVSIIVGGSHGVLSLVGRMVVAAFVEHHKMKEVATDVGGDRQCRGHGWCHERINIVCGTSQRGRSNQVGGVVANNFTYGQSDFVGFVVPMSARPFRLVLPLVRVAPCFLVLFSPVVPPLLAHHVGGLGPLAVLWAD